MTKTNNYRGNRYNLIPAVVEIRYDRTSGGEAWARPANRGDFVDGWFVATATGVGLGFLERDGREWFVRDITNGGLLSSGIRTYSSRIAALSNI